jgi:hypothetical protein
MARGPATDAENVYTVVAGKEKTASLRRSRRLSAMGTSTADQHIKAARKKHICDWCGTRIGVGEPYTRYRWFDHGDAGTTRLHPECHAAMQAEVAHQGGWIEFTPGEFPRGCNCDHDPDCPKCRARAKAENDAARF